MKAQTSAAGTPSGAAMESRELALAQCRDWLKWAAAQVDACTSIDGAAMDELLASLHGVFGTRERDSAHASGVAAAGPPQIAAVVMAIQSHDRVMQGLTHAADALRALEALLGDPRRAGSEESWRQLRERQFRSFSMAEERLLFTRMMARETDEWREIAAHPSDAVELFTTDDHPA
jgi:hypothetical protein